jgi:hypothetical protein
VSRTAFYALDQEHLTRENWDLADAFVRLHDLTSRDGAAGVARITVADLMLALEGWNLVEDQDRYPLHQNAVARIIDALGNSAGPAQ